MFFLVFFHNLSGYDAHLFVKKLGSDDRHDSLKCIPNNEEKYISFSKDIVVGSFINKEEKEVLLRREIRFLDSFRLMSSSLDALSKNLKDEHCNKMSKYYKDEQFNLLRKKGVYPCKWTNLERLNATELPPKEAFYSQLNEESITDGDYKHAQNVSKAFNCKTF